MAPQILIPIVSELVKIFTDDETDEKSKTKIKEAIVFDVAAKSLEIAAKDTRKFWQSKRWYMTLIAVLIPVLNRFFDLNLSETEMISIAGPVVAYVLGKSYEQKT